MMVGSTALTNPIYMATVSKRWAGCKPSMANMHAYSTDARFQILTAS